jgi:hypothetical protein
MVVTGWYAVTGTWTEISCGTQVVVKVVTGTSLGTH